MINVKRFIPMLTATALLFIGCGRSQNGGTTFITIGTGGVTGVYYPVGGAIATLVNKHEQEYGIRASVESTGGSVYNINAVMSGDLEFGIAQSDRQYQAWKGLGEWEGHPQTVLRAVFSLHPEVVTLIAADDSGIDDVRGLAGKRVNIGNPGSGQRGNAIDIFESLGIDWEHAMHAEALKPAEAPSLLQDGRLDAFFYTVGHPSGAIQESTAGKRRVHFVPITGMADLIAKFPFYTETTIPVALYPMASNDGDVPSIGMLTTCVTSADVPEDVVYAIVKEVISNLDQFRKLHPALAGLTAAGMLRGQSAPLHSGAAKAFREIGLLERP
jgi:TRAP transporter TAXI family solute receptor